MPHARIRHATSPLLAVLASVVLASTLAPACSSVAGPTTKTLSFAQMQMLNRGVDGEWILSEFPDAREVDRRPDGRLRKLGYWVTDPQGKARPLVLHFDDSGTLLRKDYGGPVVRPPPRNELDLDVGFG